MARVGHANRPGLLRDVPGTGLVMEIVQSRHPYAARITFDRYRNRSPRNQLSKLNIANAMVAIFSHGNESQN